MKEGDLIVFKPEDEIWIYKAFDFGKSKDAIVLIRDIKETTTDAGYYVGRWVIMQMEDGDKWALGFAPADKAQGYIEQDVLDDGFTKYMTLGEFKAKYPDGTNLIP
jgi:hypothetical protein